MQPLVDKGLRFTGNEYLLDFAVEEGLGGRSSGRATWRPRAARMTGSSSPRKGTMIWTDNMLIPKGAKNKYTAELMMDCVYDPPIAAADRRLRLLRSPVQGVAEEIAKLDPDAATNLLLFPTPDIVAKSHTFQSSADERGRDERHVRAAVGT